MSHVGATSNGTRHVQEHFASDMVAQHGAHVQEGINTDPTATPPIVSALLQGEKVCEMKIAGRSTDGSASCEDLTV